MDVPAIYKGYVVTPDTMDLCGADSDRDGVDTGHGDMINNYELIMALIGIALAAGVMIIWA